MSTQWPESQENSRPNTQLEKATTISRDSLTLQPGSVTVQAARPTGKEPAASSALDLDPSSRHSPPLFRDHLVKMIITPFGRFSRLHLSPSRLMVEPRKPV